MKATTGLDKINCKVSSRAPPVSKHIRSVDQGAFDGFWGHAAGFHDFEVVIFADYQTTKDDGIPICASSRNTQDDAVIREIDRDNKKQPSYSNQEKKKALKVNICMVYRKSW